MHARPWRTRIAIVIAAGLMAGLATGPSAAKLPPPTPEQEQAAAIKKAQADAQKEKEKQELASAMDRIAERWRARAAANNWQSYSPTSVSASAGFAASATQSSVSGQPGGQLGSAAAAAPVRSEKAGTAPRSADVKTNQPSGARVRDRIYPNER